jgi:hypothetical protein
MKEIENLGGSYPKAVNATRDAQMKWGRFYEVKTSYTPMFYSDELKGEVIRLLDEGLDSKTVAKKLRLKPPQVHAIKAHVTRGTYSKFKKEML